MKNLKFHDWEQSSRTSIWDQEPSKILISDRRRPTSVIQVIDESLFDDVTDQRFDLKVFHV